MATNAEVKAALIEAAEVVIRTQLSDTEKYELIDRFNTGTGSYRERAIEAIKLQGNLTESEYTGRTYACFDTNRKLKDLEAMLDQWKPGT